MIDGLGAGASVLAGASAFGAVAVSSDRRACSCWEVACRVLCGMIDPKPRSLTLVSPPSMELFHQQDSTGKLRSRASGSRWASACKGRSYNLPITDPLWHGSRTRSQSRKSSATRRGRWAS
ncbi:MAG: hypothetical protein U0793_23715 [Gemmataceae bacterium]